jgi:hypothetical protein
MKIRCRNLHHMGKIGMSNVFVQFSRERGHIWERCGGTDSVKDDLSPVFPATILSLQKLCHSDLKRRVKIEAMESATSDGHKPLLIGQFIAPMEQLLAKGTSHEWELLEPEKNKKRGTLSFNHLHIMVNTTKGVLNTDKPFLYGAPTQCAVRFQMAGKNIEKMGQCWLPDKISGV